VRSSLLANRQAAGESEIPMRNEFRRRSYHNMAIEHDHLEKAMNYRSVSLVLVTLAGCAGTGL
jgi:hypothetical protein